MQRFGGDPIFLSSWCLLVIAPRRELVTITYKFPQISQTDILTSIMERYGYSYRRMFIEQPRVRLDGVYIAICHYVFVSVSSDFHPRPNDVQPCGSQ
jgi:hypothetical protein